MVKPDYNRDYYADLGLPSGADISDIKRQYRQLALKYHPDRNPGQEEQAKERFVVIQVAHEILSDPVNKSKYDANRRRPAPGTAGSGARGNPYSNVSRDMSDMFGAPPKRTTRPQPTPYSNWGVPQNAPKPKPSGNPFDHLRAWDRMRPSSSKPAPTAAASGSSGPSSSSTKPPTKPAAQPPPPPPRSAYQARQQEASFGTARRTGFAPASPMGDEPQVKNNNYNSTSSGYANNLFAETAANLRKAQAQARPASAHADAPAQGYDGAFNDTRQRTPTPYASNVGEKTNPFEGASATRAKTVRESWRKSQEEEPEASPPRPSRQRSASVGDREGFPKPATHANTPPNGFPNGPGKPPTMRFASQASERYSPRPSGDAKPPQRPPKIPKSGEPQPAPAFQNATASGGAPASKPNVYGSPFNTLPKSGVPSSFRTRFDFPQAARQAADSYSSRRQAQRASTQDPTGPCVKTAAPSGAAMSNDGVSRLEQLFNDQFDVLLSKARASRAAAPVPAVSSQYAQTQRSHSHTNSTLPVSFTVPDDDTPEPQTPKADPASQQARFMRNSTESINTRFVSDDKPSKYEFNAGGPSPNRDPSRADPFLRAKQRSRSTPRGRATSTAEGPATASTANPLQTPEAPRPSAFDAGQWQQKIGPHNFVPPPVARQASSPTRPTRASKKPKASKIPAGAVVIDIEDSDGEEWRPAPAPVHHAHGNTQGAPSPNAMDIDPPSFEATATPTGGARTINVEPSKPEWRAGHVSGVGPSATTTAGPSVPPPKPHNVEPEDPPIFKEMLNVEPFAAPKPAGVGGSGLGGFGDMKLNLPFPSQAAATTPLEKEKEKQQQPKEDPMALLLKDPPTCPQVPDALAVARPSAETVYAWGAYALDFNKYLRQWTAYEKRIVEHFVVRKRVREDAGDAAFAWVHLRGNAGIRRYRRELEQDRAVRREWDLLAAAHEARVTQFAAVHERVEGLLPVPG